GIDFFAVEELAIIQTAVTLADALRAGHASLVHVADGEHADIVLVAAIDERADVASAHAADADDAHVDAVVGAKHFGGRRGRQSQRSGSGGGGFDKITAREITGQHGEAPLLEKAKRTQRRVRGEMPRGKKEKERTVVAYSEFRAIDVRRAYE